MSFESSQKSVPSYEVREFHDKYSDYCLIIPVINEGERLLTQLERIKKLKLGIDVVVADGGSTDGSVESQILEVRGVKSCLTKTGPGKLSAQLRIAFDYAINQGYLGVISMDGNGKDGVDAIERIMKQLDLGFDFVQASRFIRGGRAVNTPKSRLLGIKLVHSPLTSFAAGFKFTDSTNGFRGHSVRLLTSDRLQIFRDVFDSYELIAYIPIKACRSGFLCVEVPASREYPYSGVVPTKIHGVAANLKILSILIKASFSCYNPREPRNK